MSAQREAALSLWQARKLRSRADQLYVVYIVILVTLAAIIPVIRMLWLGVISAKATAQMRSDTAPLFAAYTVAALWCAALLAGRQRGPALLPPFLLHALALSPLSRSTVFAPQLRRALFGVVIVIASVAGLVAMSLAAQGLTSWPSAAVFVAAGVLIGACTTVLWLAGQAYRRTSMLLVFGIVLLSATGALWPTVQLVLPWHWFAAAYPTGSAFTTVDDALPLLGLTLVTTALLTFVPWMLHRLRYRDLAMQSARWQKATTYTSSFEFAAAADSYRSTPQVGRRGRATRPQRHLAATFLLRDLLGAARTPARLLVSIGAVASAALVLLFVPFAGSAALALGVTAAVILFVGIGPVTDGLRHAVSVAADYPLYGVSDAFLVFLHSIFPTLSVMLIVAGTTMIGAPTVGVVPAQALVVALGLGFAALLTRLSVALKGPLPPVLLAPIPTPMGDLSVMMQLVWALDGVIVMAVAGIAASFSTTALLVLLPLLAAAIVARWRTRR